MVIGRTGGKSVNLIRLLGVAAGLALCGQVFGAESGTIRVASSGQPAGTLGLSLRNEVNAAMDRALDWLAAQQKEDGSWSNGDFPALTGLALQAFAQGSHPRKAEVVGKATKFILSCVQPDGGIYRTVPGRKGGGLSNYNTAVCMTALHATGDRSLAPQVQRARKFLAGAQHLGGDEYRGGFGYDAGTDRKYTDLLNTYFAVSAIRETQSAEDLRPSGDARVDIDWKATVQYVERMQNTPAAGTNEAGGFFYKPGESKAGASTNAEGKVVFRSFGSMTYAGLLALIYADVSREDVRVRSAFAWACRHWSLDENPGMGQEGLYFFYNVLAKALAVYGQELVPLPDGTFLNWRDAAARKLVKVQKVNPQGRGYWVNESGRFWESDPVLVTAYALIALQYL
jgi:squalene-hopene/tetraprenyl-beta-curcumene cyclase